MKKIIALATAVVLSLGTPIQAHPSHEPLYKDAEILKELQSRLTLNSSVARNFPKLSIGSLNNCARLYRSYISWGTYFPGCDVIVVGPASLFSDPIERRLILAHEWMHHIQYRSGALYDPPKESEITADCFAGIAFATYLNRGMISESEFQKAADFLEREGNAENSGLPHASGKVRKAAFIAAGAAAYGIENPLYTRHCSKLNRVLRGAK